jgi:hypothetical protein
MSLPGPGRGRGPDSGNNHVVMSAGRGAVLVAVAVVAGLLVLAAVRDSKSSGSAETPVSTLPVATTSATPSTNLDGTPAAAKGTTAAGTTGTTKPKKTTSTTTKSGKDARPNDQVVVQVLNGSGLQGAASTRTNDLKAKAYQTAPAGNAPSQRTGNAVQCKAGYEKEAEKLVTELQTVGLTAVVEPIAEPLPSQYDATANCFLILGK